MTTTKETTLVETGQGPTLHVDAPTFAMSLVELQGRAIHYEMLCPSEQRRVPKGNRFQGGPKDKADELSVPHGQQTFHKHLLAVFDDALRIIGQGVTETATGDLHDHGIESFVP